MSIAALELMVKRANSCRHVGHRRTRTEHALMKLEDSLLAEEWDIEV